MTLTVGMMIGPLQLQRLALSQAPAFFDHIEQQRGLYQDTIPFVSRTHTLEQLTDLLRINIEKQQCGEALFYTLWDQQQMAGYVLVREIDTEARWAEIGYMLGQQWNGQGIVTQACRVLIAHLFEQLGIDKVVICCNDDNHASIAVAKRLGFQHEGTLRQHFVVNGVRRNLSYYGLLQSEW